MLCARMPALHLNAWEGGTPLLLQVWLASPSERACEKRVCAHACAHARSVGGRTSRSSSKLGVPPWLPLLEAMLPPTCGGACGRRGEDAGCVRRASMGGRGCTQPGGALLGAPRGDPATLRPQHQPPPSPGLRGAAESCCDRSEISGVERSGACVAWVVTLLCFIESPHLPEGRKSARQAADERPAGCFQPHCPDSASWQSQ